MQLHPAATGGDHEIFTEAIRCLKDFFNCFQHMTDSLAVAYHKAIISFWTPGSKSGSAKEVDGITSTLHFSISASVLLERIRIKKQS